MLAPADCFSDQPEQEYIRSTPAGEARRLGQYFTPFKVAEFMARWVLGGNSHALKCFDPAVGLGVFFRAVLKLSPSARFEFSGYDIDPQVLSSARDLFKSFHDQRIELVETEYLSTNWDERYAAILCNPPYQQFKHYKDRNKILQEFQSRLGVSLSGLTNLHTLFLLKSIYQLADNGRCAYILPSEFLNSDYGAAVKDYLLQHGSLRTVVVFDYNESLFDRVMTTSCILLFSNDHSRNSSEFFTLNSISELDHLGSKLDLYPSASEQGKMVPYHQLGGGTKWRAFYQKQNTGKFTNLIPFSAAAKAVRGIATGDNAYFLFNEEKKEKYKIEGCFLLPCLTKSMHARTNFFTQKDFENLKNLGKNVYLLNAEKAVEDRPITDPVLREYIALGEENGVHKRFLTSHRNPWYTLENRPPAPILVKVFGRNGLQFVRNEAKVYNLTCFHCVYMNPAAIDKIELLMAYLITDLAKEIFKDYRREYGQGLEKFEPNDLNGAMIIDILNLPGRLESEILELFGRYRESVITDRHELLILKNIESCFKEFCVG